MPVGRPSSYQSEFAEKAAELCRGGAVDVDLARVFGVHVGTISSWKNQFPEFREALKRNKDVADAVVENALFHRAVGYSHDAVKIQVVNGEVVQTQYVEHFPPDTTAGIFWLKNRRPDLWREKQEVQTEVTVKQDMDLSKLSREERDVMRQLLLKAGPENAGDK